MLVAFWSPKGGSGTSVLAAACAVVLARHGGVRLADLDGDQPAIFGLGTDPETGLADWLATGPEAPPDALDRLAVDAAPGVALMPAGRRRRPAGAGRRGRGGRGARGRAARRPRPVHRRRGLGRHARRPRAASRSPTSRSWSCGAATSLCGGRCVRRSLARAAGIAFVEEAGRSLGATELRDVLGRPVLAKVPGAVGDRACGRRGRPRQPAARPARPAGARRCSARLGVVATGPGPGGMSRPAVAARRPSAAPARAEAARARPPARGADARRAGRSRVASCASEPSSRSCSATRSRSSRAPGSRSCSTS